MTQLKISDLSVGDWICVQFPNGDKWDERILSLSNTGRLEVQYKDGEVVRCTIDFIHPIPITPEILEKNGFRKNGPYNEFNIGEWNENPFIGVSLDRQSLRVRHINNDIFIEDKVLSVHQLQHALRLAGVEKEIEL